MRASSVTIKQARIGPLVGLVQAVELIDGEAATGFDPAVIRQPAAAERRRHHPAEQPHLDGCLVEVPAEGVYPMALVQATDENAVVGPPGEDPAYGVLFAGHGSK